MKNIFLAREAVDKDEILAQRTDEGKDWRVKE